jgi:uncharacterized protein (TIGR03435 family)
MLRIRHNWILAGVVCLLLTASLHSFAQGAAAPPTAFEVASVKPTPPDKPGGMLTIPQGTSFNTTGMSLEILIQLAFGLEQSQIVGPDWINSERYDIAAKTEGGVSLTYEQMKPLVQRLLADRFKLTYHRETKETNGYALVAAKSGPKLQAAKPGASKGGNILRDGIQIQSATMKALASMLAIPLRQPVVDKTGIAGDYEIKLSFAPNDATDSTLPTLFTALQEQLGLRLESTKVPVEMLVIDHVEKVPTEN